MNDNLYILFFLSSVSVWWICLSNMICVYNVKKSLAFREFLVWKCILGEFDKWNLILTCLSEIFKACFSVMNNQFDLNENLQVFIARKTNFKHKHQMLVLQFFCIKILITFLFKLCSGFRLIVEYAFFCKIFHSKHLKAFKRIITW